VLGAPARIEDSEKVSDRVVGNLLELMRQLFDYVVVDCGGHVDANSVAAWEHSQEVLYVLDQSIGAVNRAGRFLDLFERLGIEGAEPRLILNRHQPGHAIGEAQIAATLRRPIYARIPRDERVMEKSAALARLPAQIAPGCALVRACEDLALRLSANDEAASADDRRSGAGFVTRLFGALGSRA
jgi:pilus assembly protein CpaE